MEVKKIYILDFLEEKEKYIEEIEEFIRKNFKRGYIEIMIGKPALSVKEKLIVSGKEGQYVIYAKDYREEEEINKLYDIKAEIEQIIFEVQSEYEEKFKKELARKLRIKEEDIIVDSTSDDMIGFFYKDYNNLIVEYINWIGDHAEGNGFWWDIVTYYNVFHSILYRDGKEIEDLSKLKQFVKA